MPEFLKGNKNGPGASMNWAFTDVQEKFRELFHVVGGSMQWCFQHQNHWNKLSKNLVPMTNKPGVFNVAGTLYLDQSKLPPSYIQILVSKELVYYKPLKCLRSFILINIFVRTV
jgi:hypothetical protein